MSTRPETAWETFFFAPRSASPMVLVRVAWGLLAALWAISLLPDIDPFFTEGELLYERSLSPGAWNLLPHLGWEHAALAICVLLLVAAVSTMVGFHTRLSAAVAVLCLIVLQRGNVSIFNAGDLLIRQVGIAVLLAPSSALLSVDAARARRRGRPLETTRAPFAMRLLQLEVCLGYFLSAWGKARGDTWHDGTALALSLRIEDLQRFVAPEWLFDQSILLNLVTWGALAFELTFFAVVWPRRLRLWVLAAGVAFHLGIDVFLDVGFFSLTVWIAYLAFLPGDVADRVVGRFDRHALEAGSGRVDGAAPDPTEPLAVQPAQ